MLVLFTVRSISLWWGSDLRPYSFSALSYEEESDNFPFVDYDGYDAQVFKLPARNAPHLGLVINIIM